MQDKLTRRQSFIVSGAAGLCANKAQAAAPSILNASFDPTAALFAAYGKYFAELWAKNRSERPNLLFSHGGSGAQARAVIEGLQADVVTLALASDIEAIVKAGLINPDWQGRLPLNSTPYTSTVVFLVRAGNPKKIRDWDDLVKPGVEVITPNPKTSGGARWNVLAAYAYALKARNGDEAAAKGYLKAFFANVPVMDTGAHGATLTFTRRNIGDVLVGWESDAYLSRTEALDEHFEIVNPSLSILAEPSVAVVDKVVDRRGSRALATAYLEGLYAQAAQDLIARNFYRPQDKVILAKYATKFPYIPMVSIDGAFGGWAHAQPKFFADGGIFDQVYGLGS